MVKCEYVANTKRVRQEIWKCESTQKGNMKVLRQESGWMWRWLNKKEFEGRNGDIETKKGEKNI